ncbi:vam6/vps39-like protein [Plakobranchus ocellatus]|uniref:Vam6/vps39-like protein n=1 Tax=Plakobranchus ocellatus TaxID=259542 RepID=A0AAV3ZQT8_9GAST|nr:vam6/vps39-like protein [Plakobranchus ocellatus]
MVTENLIHKQAVKVIVTDDDLCRSCRKRIGQSVFCRYPNGHLVHYSCFTKDANKTTTGGGSSSNSNSSSNMGK